jgi:hypothetical protein
MRLFLAGVPLVLAACGEPAGKEEEDSAEVGIETGVETDDSSSDTGGDSGGTGGGGGFEGTPSIVDWNYSCEGQNPESCSFFVDADQHLGGVRVTMVQTGDPSSSCGPKGGVNDCGVWEEQHVAFEKVEPSYAGPCGERRELVLQVVSGFQSQVDNESTLFGTRVLDTLTVMVRVYDVNGNPGDCSVVGEDPGYFAGQCD